MGVMRWEANGLQSANFSFASPGDTWQLECTSTVEQREEIDAACEQALVSISIP